MESLPREVGRGAGTITPKGYGMMQAFQIMRSFIDSLEKEKSKTDTEKLEKEIQSYLESQGVGYGGWIDGWRDEDLREIARHFFKLGQNGW